MLFMGSSRWKGESTGTLKSWDFLGGYSASQQPQSTTSEFPCILAWPATGQAERRHWLIPALHMAPALLPRSFCNLIQVRLAKRFSTGGGAAAAGTRACQPIPLWLSWAQALSHPHPLPPWPAPEEPDGLAHLHPLHPRHFLHLWASLDSPHPTCGRCTTREPGSSTGQPGLPHGLLPVWWWNCLLFSVRGNQNFISKTIWLESPELYDIRTLENFASLWLAQISFGSCIRRGGKLGGWQSH